jgi:glycosyltransferase involved in cell wall biosynthesis
MRGGKTLYLSWSVPPDTSGSAIIALNLLQQFTRDEMIVAGEKPYGKPSVQWKAEWPELHYVAWVWPFARRGLRWWRIIQFPLTVWNCLWIVWRHGVDRIVVVYPRAHILLAGYLASCLTGCKLFAYLHNTYEARTGMALRFAAWVHRLVFRRASHVFVMSEGMSELLKQRSPDLEQTPLVHSFNEPLEEFREPPAVGSPMRLVFCGNVVSCKDAAARMAEAVARTPDSALSIYSGDNPDVLRHYGLLRPGTDCRTVPRDKILEQLREADVLLLPHSFEYPKAAHDEFRTIFPTKTIEYLISGRPILAHSPADAFLTKFLEENECALVVDRPDIDALRDAIEQLRRDSALRSRLVRNALRTAEQFQAKRVATEFRKWVDDPLTIVAKEENVALEKNVV